jgi:hypothetical protein
VLEYLKKEREGNTSAKMAARREEWEAALQELFLQFEDWLKDAVDQGLLTVSTEPIVLKEKKLGPPLSVQRFIVETPAGVKFTIKPKARYVAGAEGRVDFERPPQRFSLLRRKEGNWQFVDFGTPSQGLVSEDMTEEAFWRRIQQLLGVIP